MTDKATKREFKKLAAQARDREKVHYSLKRILQDTSTGKTLQRAIQDFLEA